MKKIIVAIFAFVLLLVGQEVFASSIWNGASNDCRTIAIANYTANEGYGDPCWNLSSVDSEPGDSINVRVYYHNTSKITATNTRIILNQNNSSNGKTYTGSIVSDQGSLSFGPVNLTLPEGQTLSFSSAKWYPNQTRTPASFPSGQSGSDLMDGGINIGSVAPSWSSQGTIVAVFKVSNVQPEPEEVCSITSFTAYPTSLYLGNYTTLNWKTENCTKVTISPSLETTTQNSGTYKLFPKNTTTYRLSAYKGLNIVDTKDVTISIIKILQTIGNLTPSSSSCTIPSGASTCLIPFTWTTENPTTTSSVTSNGQTLATGNNGSRSFAISNGSKSFYLYHNSIELDRQEISAECASGSSWTGSYCKQDVVIPDSCTITSFDANDTSIEKGDYVTLSWKTENCNYVTISGSAIQLAPNGSKKFFPQASTTYKLSAYQGIRLADTKSLLISVDEPEQLTTTGNLTPSSSSCTIPSGASTCSIPFTWTTENPTTTSSVTSNGQTLATGNNGSRSFAISNGSKSFYLYHNSIELDREEVSASCASGSSWTGSYCKQNVVIPDSCTITSFDANDTSIEKGDYVTISWKTENCNYVNIPGIGTNLFPNGSKIMRPSYSTTYAMTAYGTNNIDSDTLKVYVDENNDEEDDECRVTDFSVNDSSISEGDSVRLEWETEGCDYVNIAGVGSNLSENGSKRVYPNSTKTYTLKAYGDNGNDSDTVKVYVDEDDDEDECRVTDFNVDDSSISEGDSVRLEWETEGCDYVNIAGVGSNLSENGSKRVYPNSTKTYTLKAYGDNGNDSDTVKVYVDEEDEYIDNTPVVIYNSCAVTTVATNINKNGAYLNGLVTNSNSSSNNVYFEYGTTASLGSRTQTRTIYSNGSFSEVIAGLSPNTIYFFRAVSDCNNGTSFGSIEVFRTLGNDVVRPVIIQGNTIVGEKSPVMLDITNRYPAVSVEDTIDYTITYKNIGKTTLRDPMLQVIVPSYITLTNSSEGTYSNETHTLSVPLSDLQKDESGVVYLEGLVESIPSNNAKIVSTAVLVYTNTDNGQENAMAYVLNTPRDMIQIIENNSLGAAALFGNFCSTGLIWWLLIIIIILLIILITRSYQQKKTIKTETIQTSSVK